MSELASSSIYYYKNRISFSGCYKFDPSSYLIVCHIIAQNFKRIYVLSILEYLERFKLPCCGELAVLHVKISLSLIKTYAMALIINVLKTQWTFVINLVVLSSFHFCCLEISFLTSFDIFFYMFTVHWSLSFFHNFSAAIHSLIWMESKFHKSWLLKLVRHLRAFWKRYVNWLVYTNDFSFSFWTVEFQLREIILNATLLCLLGHWSCL